MNDHHVTHFRQEFWRVWRSEKVPRFRMFHKTTKEPLSLHHFEMLEQSPPDPEIQSRPRELPEDFVAWISLQQIHEIEMPYSFSINLTHLGVLFVLDNNHDGRVVEQDLVNLLNYMNSMDEEVTSSEFIPTFYAMCLLELWRHIQPPKSNKVFTDWMRNIVIVNQPIQRFSEYPDQIFIPHETIRAVHSLFGLLTYFDVGVNKFIQDLQDSADDQNLIRKALIKLPSKSKISALQTNNTNTLSAALSGSEFDYDADSDSGESSDSGDSTDTESSSTDTTEDEDDEDTGQTGSSCSEDEDDLDDVVLLDVLETFVVNFAAGFANLFHVLGIKEV